MIHLKCIANKTRSLRVYRDSKMNNPSHEALQMIPKQRVQYQTLDIDYKTHLVLVLKFYCLFTMF